MKDFMYIGSSPASESPLVSVGMPGYSSEIAREEAMVFAKQIRRQFPLPNDHAKVKVVAQHHDAGIYYEVIVEFNDMDADSEEWAYNVEGECPQIWDDFARREMIELQSKLQESAA